MRMSKVRKFQTDTFNRFRVVEKKTRGGKIGLTLPLPSLLVPTRLTKRSYLKNSCPMNVKFGRVLETPLKVLEILKLFT